MVAIYRFQVSGFGPPWSDMTDSHCSLQEIPILPHLPDSYKIRSGPGVSGKRVAKSSYETTPKWHVFLVINPVALAADSRAEKRMTNCGCRFALLFLTNKIERIHYSTFDICHADT